MRGFLVLAIVSAAAAAPTGGDARDINILEETQRTKKSPAYGGGGSSYGLSALPSVGGPCAGAAPLAPVTFYALAPQAGPAPGPLHYRENEHMEHQQARASNHGRSYYDSSAAAVSASLAAAAAGAAAGAGAGASGPAIGLFPNAKVGGCAVPLLLSCAPNVVSGHLAHQPSYAASSASSYGALSSAGSAASVAVPLAPSGYRAQETNNFEHNIRNANSGSVATIISEPSSHFPERALSLQ